MNRCKFAPAVGDRVTVSPAPNIIIVGTLVGIYDISIEVEDDKGNCHMMYIGDIKAYCRKR